MSLSSNSFYADLHIHSKYSRATSKHCDLEHLSYWARKKGIAVIGTGDFTHPKWREELRDKLVPAEPGLFRLRDDLDRAVCERLGAPATRAPRFMLSVEISTIYKKGDKTRKVHHLVYAPDLASVDRMVARLAKIGNLRSDGRPILGLDSRDLLEIVLDAGEHCYLIPAHVWTPWFAVLGSKSGFDQIDACYGDLSEHIFAIETGLSSDPSMNWRLSALDRYTLVSNSDAHSPAKLGREVCVFETDMDYFAMRRALETRAGYGGTLEFFPEEGKYHLDGHRKCGVVLEPEQTLAHGGMCPECGRPLTVGVVHRVTELADRPHGARPQGASPFRSLVPLPEMLAEILNTGAGSKRVGRTYESLIAQVGAELDILDRLPIEELDRSGHPQVAEAVARMRAGRVIRSPGFDGEYGVIRLFEDGELRRTPAVSLHLALPEPSDTAPLPEPATPATDAAGVAAPVASTAAPSNGPGPTVEPRAATSPPAAPTASAATATDAGSQVLDGLDPDQRRAAACVSGGLLIVAGPGTGKTRTLTHRIAHLVVDHGVPAAACLAITFTNRAAAELRERLAALLPAGARATVTTFHGLGLTILREHRVRAGLHRGFRVAGEVERVAVLAQALGCSQRKASGVLSRLARLGLLRASPPESAPVDDDTLAALAVYRAALEQAALVDFDELLVRAVRLLADEVDIRRDYRRRFRHVSIDEYQDIDGLQYRLVELLCGQMDGDAEDEPDTDAIGGSVGGAISAPAGDATRGRSLCAIGDPDQAIYGFRGADVGFFLRFRHDFAGAREIHLTRNYRSTATIVQAAVQAIAPTSLVAGRSLVAVQRVSAPGAAEPGNVAIIEAASERAEAETVVHTIEALMGGTSFFSMDSGRVDHGDGADLGFGDIAVLYRVAGQAEPLCEALARSGIPFQRRAHTRLADQPLVQALVERMQDSLDAALPVEPVDAASPRQRAGECDPNHGVEDPDGLTRPGPLEQHLRAAAALLAEQGHDQGDRGGPDQLDLDTAVEMLLPLAARCGGDLAGFLTELSMDSEVDLWDPRADRVSLLTLHAAKGLEFRVVFLVGCEDGILPMRWGARTATAGGRPRPDEALAPGTVIDSRSETGDDRRRGTDEPADSQLESAGLPASLSGTSADAVMTGQVSEDPDAEERRLFFVGLTRAQEQLYLLHARKRRWRGVACELPLSPFVAAIEDALLDRHRRRARRKAPAGHEQLGLF